MDSFRLKLALVLSLFSCVAVIAHYSPKVGIRINRTDSLPYTFFFSRSVTGDVRKGDFVVISRSECAIPIMKRVEGVPGDKVETGEGRLVVSGEDFGPISDKLPALESQVIPDDYFLLLGNHEESFDSRYDQFGLVGKSEVMEVAWPIF